MELEYVKFLSKRLLVRSKFHNLKKKNIFLVQLLTKKLVAVDFVLIFDSRNRSRENVYRKSNVLLYPIRVHPHAKLTRSSANSFGIIAEGRIALMEPR